MMSLVAKDLKSDAVIHDSTSDGGVVIERFDLGREWQMRVCVFADLQKKEDAQRLLRFAIGALAMELLAAGAAEGRPALESSCREIVAGGGFGAKPKEAAS